MAEQPIWCPRTPSFGRHGPNRLHEKQPILPEAGLDFKTPGQQRPELLLSRIVLRPRERRKIDYHIVEPQRSRQKCILASPVEFMDEIRADQYVRLVTGKMFIPKLIGKKPSITRNRS